MVNVNVLGGYDNVTFPPGETAQSTVSTLNWGAALESYGGGTLGVASTPAGNGYIGWSLVPEDALTNQAVTTLNGYLTRVVASSGGPCGHLDLVVHTTGTTTNAVFGLYSGTSFASGPLAWTADVHASLTVGTTALTWNGASSPTSVNLLAGVPYWVYMEITTSVAPTIAASNPAGAANATMLNVNLTASATNANNAMSIAAGPTSLTSSTAITPQTSWANAGFKFWFGLRA